MIRTHDGSPMNLDRMCRQKIANRRLQKATNRTSRVQGQSKFGSSNQHVYVEGDLVRAHSDPLAVICKTTAGTCLAIIIPEYFTMGNGAELTEIAIADLGGALIYGDVLKLISKKTVAGSDEDDVSESVLFSPSSTIGKVKASGGACSQVDPGLYKAPSGRLYIEFTIDTLDALPEQSKYLKALFFRICPRTNALQVVFTISTVNNAVDAVFAAVLWEERENRKDAPHFTGVITKWGVKKFMLSSDENRSTITLGCRQRASLPLSLGMCFPYVDNTLKNFTIVTSFQTLAHTLSKHDGGRVVVPPIWNHGGGKNFRGQMDFAIIKKTDVHVDVGLGCWG